MDGKAAREDVVMVRNYRIAGIMMACGEDDGCRWAVRRNCVRAQSCCLLQQPIVSPVESLNQNGHMHKDLCNDGAKIGKCLFQERKDIYQLVSLLILDQISNVPMNVAFNLCGPAPGLTNNL